MYICLSCGALLDSPVAFHEYHDELDECPFEEYHGCSHCKSRDVVEAVQCDMCGEYVGNGYVVLSDGTVACEDCYILH